MARASKIGRLAGRAVIVGVLTVGAWTAGMAAANAEWSWSVNPADGTPSSPASESSQPTDVTP